MAEALFLGAAVGGVFGLAVNELYASLKKLIVKNLAYESILEDTISLLESLMPLIQRMTALYSDEELQDLHEVITEGKVLVDVYLVFGESPKEKDVEKFGKWDNRLKRQIELLNVQSLIDGRKTAVNTEKMLPLVQELLRVLNKCSETEKQNLSAENEDYCAVPELPPLTVGLDGPTKELKTMMFDEGKSMIVVNAMGGSGKTTLAINFCRDPQVEEMFKNNIFFVNVSKEFNLKLILQQLHQRKGLPVPALTSQENVVTSLHRFLKKEECNPLLLVLDDVWPESETFLVKFLSKEMNYKILVTSRSQLLGFASQDSQYKLESLNGVDAMKLFNRSTNGSPDLELSEKIVQSCKGLPLALMVVGGSLSGQPIDIWRKRIIESSKGRRPTKPEDELYNSLHRSLDNFDKNIKEYFLDLGAFPDHKRISVGALIDMWAELYDLTPDRDGLIREEEDTLCNAELISLKNRNLVNLVDTRKDKIDEDGYRKGDYVTLHDLLKEQAIQNSGRGPEEQRTRLIVNIRGDNIPRWWRKQKFQARLLSVSTDGEFSNKLPNMTLEKAEVLMLNFRTKKYLLPEFVKNMAELRVLFVKYDGSSYESYQSYAELDKIKQLGSLPNLRRITLQSLSMRSITKNPFILKSLLKMSLILCDLSPSRAFSIGSLKISDAFPKLEELIVDRCYNCKEFLTKCCDLVHLTKLSIINCGGLYFLPKRIGSLVNLEVLRLRSCNNLLELPDSVANLTSLKFLDISECYSIGKLPISMGEMRSLAKLDLRYCKDTEELRESVSRLEQLEEVICTCMPSTEKLWEAVKPSRGRIRILVGTEVSAVYVGTEFGAVYDGIEELISKNLTFKFLFKEIKSSLDSLKPLIEQIEESNTALPYCPKEELEDLKKVIKKGVELVSKCLKVSLWNPFIKYKYANKLLDWDASLKGQLEILMIQNIRDGKKTAVAVQGMQVSLINIEKCTKNLQLTQSSSSSSTKLELPPLPPLILGLDVPLKELKEKLLEDDGVSMLVLTAPGGCGKTTLATKFCQEQDVKDKFKDNIFFVTVSKTPKLELIMTELYKQKGFQVPTFQNGVFPVKWLQKIVEEGHDKPLLLVLDDVWSRSESLLQKFEFKMSNYKILVTSRSKFPRFGPSYDLQLLDDDNAMQLFHHTAFLEDKSSHIPKDLAKKIVKHCNGFPLAITVVGRSLCGQPIETWQSRVNEWSRGASVLDCEMELFQCLQSSFDALDNATPKVKECLLDLGAFPEDAEIQVTALIDMWAELYDLDEETSSIAKLFELHNRNLALLQEPEWYRWEVVPEVIDYSERVVRQPDFLRELAIYNTKRDQMDQRERLIIEICGNNFPKWWREQKYSYMNARLVSISTDGEFSVKFPNMELPEAEVLVLNVQSKTYALPEFVKKMDKLKMLLVTNYSSLWVELDNFQLLGSSSNLRSIRLDGIDFSCMTESPVQLLNVHKLYLRGGRCVGKYPTKLSHVFPNLKEMVIEKCELESPDELYELIHLTKLKLSLCQWLTVLSEAIGNLVSLEVLTLEFLTYIPVVPDSIGNLKKLKFLKISGTLRIEKLPEHMGKLQCLTHLIITACFSLYVLPESIGNLVNLEVLSLMGCSTLSKLPESIRNLQKLNFLDINACEKIEELPEHIGELKSSLRKLEMVSCKALRKLPESVSELEKLEEVVCDDWQATHLWTPLLPTLRNLRIVRKGNSS